MTSIIRETGTGLVVAEQAADERAVGHALRQIDDRLALQHRPPYYVVVKVVSEREAPVIYTWMTATGDPLPLSSGLVEDFKKHRLDAPNKPPTVDERNRMRLAELEREWADAADALNDDHRGRVDRGRRQVSLAHHPRPAWQRRNGGRLH